MNKDLPTALHPTGVSAVTEGSHLFIEKNGFNKEVFHNRKLLLSLLQPKGRLQGDQGRGEDPFRKKLAEPGPPGKRPGRRKQENVYLYTKNTLSTLWELSL
ncbi:MAG: hypothetical protein EA344_01055 [Alkalicoccus sp.]|uniref:Uncharacterized protein n=1 Tax=Alkalicoccus sp. TaxID=2005376 RepID=A0A651E653_9BACI|nr:MAG: hypothetical protein EA344_01055 [Alkalicoccus sp.]